MRNDFNPRSLTGATGAMYAQRTLEGISIHAPLRERQFNLGEGLTITDISIHAPSRERLPELTAVSHTLPRFQSTLPRGSDGVSGSFWGEIPISIHAPSRERHFKSWLTSRPLRFQSTLPRGSDCTGGTVEVARDIFQSTLPRGSDLRRCINMRSA